MSPILGIWASQGRISNSYESIATQSVTSGTSASLTFSSIPSTYKHLQIRGFIRTDAGSNNWDLRIRMNSDSGSNYARHSMRGEGTGTGNAEGQSSQTYMWLDRVAPNDANIFADVIIDLLEYSNSNIYKTMRGFGGNDRNGSGIISFSSGVWTNTSVINSLTFTLSSGNFTQYSTLALYGIKGA